MCIVFVLQSTGSKQLPNCLKGAEIRVVLIIFNGVLYHDRAYDVTVSYLGSSLIKYQKSYILVSDRILQRIIKAMQSYCSNRTSVG